MRRLIDKFIEVVITLFISLMVIMVCWQVITRYVLGNPSTVTEEFLRYMLIWTTMLGAAYAYGRGKHLSIVYFTRKLSQAGQCCVNIFVQLVTILFSSLIFLRGGVKVALNAIGQNSAALSIPMEYIYFSIVTCGVLFIFYSVIFIKESVTELRGIRGRSSSQEVKNNFV